MSATKENWDDESSDEEGDAPPGPLMAGDTDPRILRDDSRLVYDAIEFTGQYEAKERADEEADAEEEEEEEDVFVDAPSEAEYEGAEYSDDYDDDDYDDEIDKKLGRYVSCR